MIIVGEGIKIRIREWIKKKQKDKDKGNDTWMLDLRKVRKKETKSSSMKKVKFHNWNMHKQVMGSNALWQNHIRGVVDGVCLWWRTTGREGKQEEQREAQDSTELIKRKTGRCKEKKG